MSKFVDTSTLDAKFKKLKDIKSQVMPEAYNEFTRNTPVDTGNAKQNTRLRNDMAIEAKYDYAEILDKGRHTTSKGARGSNQAPDGMSQPTIDKMPKMVADYIRKI